MFSYSVNNPKIVCAEEKPLEMCYSLSSSLSLPSNKPFFFHPSFDFCFPVRSFVRRPRNTKPFSLLASNAHKNLPLELSWTSWDKVDLDECNGWAIADVDPTPLKQKSLPAFVVIGIGASAALLVGLFACFSISSKGFKFRLRSPVDAFHWYQVPHLVDKKDTESEKVSFDSSTEDAEVSVDDLEGVPESHMAGPRFNTMKERKDQIIVPLAADYAQQEAMLALKKLKIIEDDGRADELCTRRQYARWLVLANSQLERSRKHRLISSVALSGSKIAAFDDVGVEDPDFEHIQSLAESGVIRSKLSEGKTSLNSDDLEGTQQLNFSPDRFISREDLVSWKAKIEYQVMPGTEEMSLKNIGFLDVKAISPNVLMEIYLDALADEKSILRGVFGQISCSPSLSSSSILIFASFYIVSKQGDKILL